MPSPFPGMDPYLEPHWPDVHNSLIAEGRRSLNHILPAGYVARTEQRVAVEDEADGGEPGTFVPIRPDVRVVGSAGDRSSTATVIDAPYKLLPSLEPHVERYLKVTDAGGQLLAVVEVISPANKRNPGLNRFRRNRAELLATGVNVVEIDLVRAGNWREMMSPNRCPPDAASLYRAIVRTTGPDGDAYLYPIRLADRLPDVAVPFRPGIPPALLPLQHMLTAAYDDGRYGETIDYARPLDPPLDAADAAWTAALLGRGTAVTPP